ncbi:hypothetical protein [Streptomyces sp. NPDC089795]|uniref:hypothetical protein n=1 Tax=Streptomyces sp. NPDC089795 TaxID=3155297 RepID=UPI00343884F0
MHAQLALPGAGPTEAAFTAGQAGEAVDTDTVGAVVGGLADLVSRARRQGRAVYRWVA